MSVQGKKKYVNHLALFKLRTKKDDNNELPERIIINARKSGELNLTSKGLATGEIIINNYYIIKY